ncbi:MAG: IclR family transcriptional regulator [Pseudomonadota bacterium]
MEQLTSVDRALLVLTALEAGPSTMSLAEIADTSGLNKATIIRLIKSLERFGFVSRVGAGRYSLGASCLRLGAAFQGKLLLKDIVLPYLDELRDRTGETAALFTRQGDKRVCLHLSESKQTLRVHLAEGQVLAMLPSAPGMILAAFSEEDGGEHDAVRAEYVAAHFGVRNPEVASVAAPVFGPNQTLLAAISVRGPIMRFNDQSIPLFRRAVLTTAAKITDALGGDPTPLQIRAASLPRLDLQE